MTTHHDIEHDLNEKVMMIVSTPAEVTAGTRAVLTKVDPHNMFVVLRFAGELADAIEFERAFQRRRHGRWDLAAERHARSADRG